MSDTPGRTVTRDQDPLGNDVEIEVVKKDTPADALRRWQLGDIADELTSIKWGLRAIFVLLIVILWNLW